MAVGLTEAGPKQKINEDTFQCMSRIYPDTLDHFELQCGRSHDYWQVYSVTDGKGGPGIGDLSGRLVQEVLIEHVKELRSVDPQTFDFAEFAQKYVDAADAYLRERLKKYQNRAVGCSLAFILICGRTAYTMSIGTNRLYLLRDDQLFRMSQDHKLADLDETRPLLFLGNHPGADQIKAHNLNKLELEANDILLILSDGATSVLEDQEIYAQLADQPSFVNSIQALHQSVKTRQDDDNSTIIGLKVQHVKGVKLDGSITSSLPDLRAELPLSVDVDRERSQRQAVPQTPERRQTQPMDRKRPVRNGDRLKGGKRRFLTRSDHTETKLKKGLMIFLQSFGIGVCIGILLILLFWIFYLGF